MEQHKRVALVSAIPSTIPSCRQGLVTSWQARQAAWSMPSTARFSRDPTGGKKTRPTGKALSRLDLGQGEGNTLASSTRPCATCWSHRGNGGNQLAGGQRSQAGEQRSSVAGKQRYWLDGRGRHWQVPYGVTQHSTPGRPHGQARARRSNRSCTDDLDLV